MQLADSILNKVDSVDNQRDSMSRVDSHSTHKPYNLLKQQLRHYYELAQSGSWQPIPSGTKKFSKGKSYTVVSAIK